MTNLPVLISPNGEAPNTLDYRAYALGVRSCNAGRIWTGSTGGQR